MKTRLPLTVASLLFLAMLLVNLVLIVLWKRDALQREAERDQAVLAHIHDRLSTKPVPARQSSGLLSFADYYPAGATGQFIFWRKESEMPDDLPPLVSAALIEASATGHPVIRSPVVFAGLLTDQKSVLISTRPLLHKGKVSGAFAVIRPAAEVLHALCQAEKIVLIYIVVNLLTLSTLFLLRINSLIARPVERLVQLASQHSGHGSIWFAAEDSSSEFVRLAGSLNSMLDRIADDRTILQRTIADVQRANQQLHERQQEVIRAEKLASVGRMAAGLAHEIGNPLAVIQGYLSLLARSNQNEENQDFIRRADQELQRVSNLTRQLLEYARVSKGRPEQVSLHALLPSVVEMVRVQAAFRDMTVTIQADAEQDTVFADPDQLRQVLLNCLLNSADAIHSAGRADGVITLATDMPEPMLLRLCIADNGIGVTEEQLAAVFDPFYTTKEPGKGTGLGLPVSRSLIETAGGFMKMDSKAGQGSVVSICLPLATETGHDGS